MADNATVNNVTVEGEVFIPSSGSAKLKISSSGAVLETTKIELKPGEIGGDEYYGHITGARFYEAVNKDAQDAASQEEPAAGFLTETARDGGSSHHSYDDVVGVFGSCVCSGTFVGGMAVQASDDHDPDNLGTKVLFIYTPNKSDKWEIGAILEGAETTPEPPEEPEPMDGPGVFKTMVNFQHLGTKLGFYGAGLTTKPVVHKTGKTCEQKVDSLISALVTLGLVETD